MNDALIVSNVLLWIAVVALAGVVLALVRQIGVLHERVAPAGALMVRGGPVVGEAAPVVEAPDWSGAVRHVGGASESGRSTLVFFVSPSCPVCKTLLPVVASVGRHEGDWLDVVVASDGPRAEHEGFVREHALDRGVYLLSTELGLTYRVAKLPYAVLLDAEGIVRAAGLVNSREHLESLFEAKERGAPSLQSYLDPAGGERRVA